MGRFSSHRPGYIFLITVLVIGAIATTAAVSLILLGIAAEQSGATVQQSAQALEMAQTCAERALRSLRADITYDGGETVTLDPGGTCTIHPIGGSGNDERTLCIEGLSGNALRRLEIAIADLYPRIRIDDWREVAEFSSHCPSS